MHIYLNAPLRSGIPCILPANVLSLLLHSDGQITNTNASERIEELWSCSVFWDAGRRKVNRDPIQVARRDQIWPLHGITTPDRELWSGISVAAQAANRVLCEHACGCSAGASAWMHDRVTTARGGQCNRISAVIAEEERRKGVLDLVFCSSVSILRVFIDLPCLYRPRGMGRSYQTHAWLVLFVFISFLRGLAVLFFHLFDNIYTATRMILPVIYSPPSL